MLTDTKGSYAVWSRITDEGSVYYVVNKEAKSIQSRWESYSKALVVCHDLNSAESNARKA